ncbi:MAG: site-specific integrase [Lachnospiraceae bacterium]|nr:site-specific integrase [Lachnospiraceae bacterium]
MPVYKDEKKRTWYVMCWFKDWQGNKKQKCKRGFETKREAQEWERQFLLQRQADVTMTLESFYELYKRDLGSKIRENTWQTKESVIQEKVLPYLGKRKLSEITPQDVIEWQNQIRELTYGKKGKKYSSNYLKGIHNQLSAIFNHAMRYYGLKSNPAAVVGNMGKEECKEKDFWTKEEYEKFSEAIMDKPISYYAFELLYWTGMREGELLALTSDSFDFEGQFILINKSYQRLHGEDVITEPKTKKSNRYVKMPNFLCEEIKDYLKMYYGMEGNDRIFPVTKGYLHHEMDRGCKESGVKRIRIHDLRHSHVSMLIDMGFTALAIGDRVGHESERITYQYAHLFPTVQTEMADKLEAERGGNAVS